MPDNEREVIKILRLLTPKNREKLLAVVHKAYMAECTLRKTFDIGFSDKYVLSIKTQDYFCENSIDRSKK